MNSTGVCLLLVFSIAIGAQEQSLGRTGEGHDCMRDAVDAHVRAQFAKYGPLSENREYFGFIFVLHGEIDSAVAMGRVCLKYRECSIDTKQAAPLIPKGAKVLGEWHTHPHESNAGQLSSEDVRGAFYNRHIRCYAAYYSQPDGDIYSWDPQQPLVPGAMTSRSFMGNYAPERRLVERQ